jgi:glycine cleavage system H protein
VAAVNEALKDKPEKINEDPYGDGWLVKVKLSDLSEGDQLMDAAAYRKLLEEQT